MLLTGISAAFRLVFAGFNPGPDSQRPGYAGLDTFEFQPNMQSRAHEVV